MTSTPRPSPISGGCLCGSIRYTVSFPPESEWPPSKNAPCQCTRCRKWTGAILSQASLIPTANIHPHLSSNPTYATYTPPAPPYGLRIFCSSCGSSIAIQSPEGTDLFLGTLDEEVLCGKKGDATPKSTKWGEWSERSGGVGEALCETDTYCFLENCVSGVTDGMVGKKYLTDREGGEPFKGGIEELGRELGS